MHRLSLDCSERGLFSSCGVQASHCSGFSRWEGSSLIKGSVTVVHGFRCSGACGIFRSRDQTHVLCTGWWVLNHWTVKEAPYLEFSTRKEHVCSMVSGFFHFIKSFMFTEKLSRRYREFTNTRTPSFPYC